MTPAERVALLVAAAPARRAELDALPALATELARHVSEITTAWPTLPIDEARYLRRLAAALERRTDEPAGRVIEMMPAADLYLAGACADGDPAALALFRTELVPGLRHALGMLKLPTSTIDETEQQVLVMLFVGEVPQIAGYAGRGRLRSWLRSVGVRTGRRLSGVIHGSGEAGLDELDELPAAVRDPGLDVLRTRYVSEVRQAFATALAGLTQRQRTVLRQYHIDGLTIDQLAALYRINRATAARWVAGARLDVITATRRLVVESGVPTSEVDSIIRLVRSQLSVSLRELG